MLSRIETVEHFFPIFTFDAHASIYHAHFEIIRSSLQAQFNLPTIRCELKGVRQKIHHNLVHVVWVNVHIQLLHIMFKRIGDISVLRIGDKHIEDILHEIHQFHLTIVEQEFALLNFPHIHHLIDESQDSLRILLDESIVALPFLILIRADESLQRSQNQRHRRTNLMADVHEELDASLIQFALLTIAGHNVTNTHLTSHIPINQPTHSHKEQEIRQFCPYGSVPSRMHHSQEGTFVCHRS